MRLSVILCTCNRQRTLGRALQSILDNRNPPDELIVVDQSDDVAATRSVLSTLQTSAVSIDLIRDSGKGVARSRNLGWRHASGEIIGYTDDDAFVDPGWCDAAREVFRLPTFRTGVAGGRILADYEARNPAFEIPAEWAFILPVYDAGPEIRLFPAGDLPPTVNYAVRRDLLEEIGGFEENIGLIPGRRVQIYGADSQVTLQVRDLGYDIVYHPDLLVHHPVPLARQNQQFFNRRLFSEGASEVYLKLKREGRTPRVLARLALRKPAKLLLHELWRRRSRSRVRFLGERAHVLGELYMLAKYGFGGSERF
jgi:glycosyltransferase involved in cell wall biosynthesis